MTKKIITNLPLLSLIIPTLNEEKRIGFCLNALLSQNYPRDKMEIIIVDGGSEDKTLSIVNNFSSKVKIKVVDNSEKKDPETAKFLGFQEVQGEIFTCLDADMYLTSPKALKIIIASLKENESLCAAFVGYFVNKKDKALNRFISYDFLQRDPFYQFLTPKMDSALKKKEKNYQLCRFAKENLPTIGGTGFYRRKLISPILKNKDKYFDIDIPLELVERGYNQFAYVDKVGYYHQHARSLINLLKKRWRNVDNGIGNGYLPNYQKRKYRWLNPTEPKNFFLISLWIIYANLFFPELIRGITKSLKYKDVSFLYEPIVALLVTDVVLFAFLKNPIFWQIIKKSVKKSLSLNE